MSLRIVIADDEPVALDHLRRMFTAHADVQIVGEAHDGADAVDLIRRERPDAAILDIEMPEIDGIGVLRLLGDEWQGRVIFATAYESYAISAFEWRALDYLLKPIAPQRLEESLARLRGPAGEHRDVTERQPPQGRVCVTPPTPPLQRVAVLHLGSTIVVPIDAVEWIEADDNYVRLHCSTAQTYLLRGKLTALEARLDPRHFMRVHRSHIVRLESIQRLDEWARGGLLLMLRSGARVEVSRAHRKRVMAQLSL